MPLFDVYEDEPGGDLVREGRIGDRGDRDGAPPGPREDQVFERYGREKEVGLVAHRIT